MIEVGGQCNRGRVRWRLVACAAAVFACMPATAASADACAGDPTKTLAPAAPEDVGLLSGALARLVAELRQNELDIRGLIVSRNCRTVVELYATGIGRNHNHAIYSVTKSVQVTLVGALIQQRKLTSIDVPVAELLPKPAAIPDANWDKLRRIRLAHVLSMSSGLDYKHDPSTHPIYRAPNRLAYALLPPIVFEPGRNFLYSDGDASIAGSVVAARAGKDLKSFADEALFDPLGFENADGVCAREIALQPDLRIRHGRIAVRGAWREADIGRLAVVVPAHGEEACDRLRRGGADIALDQVEYEVVPRHGGARHDELLPFAGRDQHLLQAQLDIRKVAPEGLLVGPVHGRLLARQEVGFREEQQPRAGRAERGAVAVHRPEPANDFRVAARHPFSAGDHDRGDDDDRSGRRLRSTRAPGPAIHSQSGRGRASVPPSRHGTAALVAARSRACSASRRNSTRRGGRSA
jgi:hypothetical protein